jgi:hypothetical protein
MSWAGFITSLKRKNSLVSFNLCIIYLITLLIWSTVCFFCVDYPFISEEHQESDYKQPLFYGWSDPNVYDLFFIRVLGINSGIHWHDTRPYLQRVGFPHYFSKRAESLLDICFLVFPTIVVIFFLFGVYFSFYYTIISTILIMFQLLYLLILLIINGIDLMSIMLVLVNLILFLNSHLIVF